MAKTAKNLFKRIFLYVTIIIFSVFILGIVFAYIYEDEIKDITIKQINKSINTKIVVENIDLSLFSQFPKASLKFNKVNIISKGSDSITIIKADKIFLNFDVIDIINGDYNLDNIVIDNAVINYIINKNGISNFNFFNSNNTDSSGYFLNLSSVRISNTIFNYTNKGTRQKASINIIESSFNGIFTPDKFNITLSGRNILEKYENKGRSILKNKYFNLNVQLIIDPKTGLYKLEKGQLLYQGVPLNLTGELSIHENYIGINAKLIASNIPAKKIIENLPKDRKLIFEKYKPNGLITINTNINGKIGGKYIPLVNASIILNNFSFFVPNKELDFQNLSAKIKYSNGKNHNLKSSKLQIKNLVTKSNLGSIKAELYINNFWKPAIKTNITSTIDLQVLKTIIKIDTIEKLSGQADISTNISLNLSFNDSNNWDIKNLKMANHFNISTASFAFINSKTKYDSIYCQGSLNNDNLHIQSFKLLSENTILKGRLRIINLPFSIFNSQNKSMIIKANISANEISYNQIMQSLPSSKSKDSRFSDKLIVNIGFSFDQFYYGDLSAQKAKGLFSMSNRRISLRNINLQSFNGNIKADVFIDGTKQELYNIKSQGKVTNIDIDNLFQNFNNFNQSIITHKNINGDLTSNFILNLDFDKDWNSNSNSIELNANIFINDGVLRNLKSLDALKSYTKIDDFSTIKFKTIKNNISIKNSILTIPNMDINSDKMNVNISGTHTFDNVYEYHFNVLLSEVMGEKYHKTLTSEFGEIENDGNNRSKLFFTIIGKGDDFEVKYDKSGLGKKIKEDLNDEKNSLKDALNKEFGWFKKEQQKRKNDSIKALKKLEKDDVPKTEEGFSIEWDDEDDETENPPN